MAEALPDIRSIFSKALEFDSREEISRYLDDVCRNDRDLRQELEALINSHKDAGNFLGGATPSDGTIEHVPIAERPGMTIGSYKLLQQIGKGGFAVVFEAEQERPVRRRVALKVIKPGMDTREVIARFEAERQALAMMDHPNIAKVHDAGMTEHGRPYFVMELVPGIPITKYCDQCNLTTQERLELFVTVCQAVQHAHQKGVIHRDIKPSNVLVAIQDGKPSPKIIDFGVAKAINQQLTEHTLMTAFAQVVGTPLYMSPEQAELSPLGVDTRSDIYSLGVLLYELLIGTTPFDKERLHAASYDEFRRIIREEEPPRPSARISTLAADRLATVAEHRRTDARRLRQTVRDELDWIVMKCLEKDRNRRYESAGGLARDVERYLRDEPVQACPPSTSYRLQKFVRRNKLALAAAGAVMSALLVGLGASAWMYGRERAARKEAEEATYHATQLLVKAEANAKIVQAQFLARNRDTAESEREIAAIDPLLKQLNSGHAADVYRNLGSLRAAQARWQEAAPFLVKAVELEPTDFEHYHWAMPVVMRNNDRYQYDKLRQQVVSRFGGSSDPRIAERVIKDCLIAPWPDANYEVLDKLAAIALSVEPTHWARSYFEFAQGLLDYRKGEFGRASGQMDKVLRASRDRNLTVQAYMVSAMSKHQLGQRERAASILMRGLDAARTLPREDNLLDYIGWNDWVIARALMDEASKLTGNSLPGVDASRALTLRAEGLRLRAQEKFAEAEPLFRQAYEIHRNQAPADPFDTAVSATLLGDVLVSLNRHDQAGPLFRIAISEFERVTPEDARSVAMARLEYAKTLAALGRFSEAESQQLDAKRALGPGEVHSTVSMIALYATWDQAEPGKGHDAKAQEWLRRLIDDSGYRRPTTSDESKADAEAQPETRNP
jgi:serine/threonine protein kinase